MTQLSRTLSDFRLPFSLDFLETVTDDPEQNLERLILYKKRDTSSYTKEAMREYQGILKCIFEGIAEAFKSNPKQNARFYILTACHYPTKNKATFKKALDAIEGRDDEVIKAVRTHRDALKDLLPRDLTLHSSKTDAKVEVNEWLLQRSSSYGEKSLNWGQPVKLHASQESFNAFRDYLETGSIELEKCPADTHSGLVKLAHTYRIGDLSNYLSSKLPTMISSKNVLQLLHTSQLLGQKEIEQACLTYLGKREEIDIEGDHLTVLKPTKWLPNILPSMVEVTLKCQVSLKKSWKNVRYVESDQKGLEKTFPRALFLPKGYLEGKSTGGFWFEKQPNPDLLAYLLRKGQNFAMPGLTYDKGRMTSSLQKSLYGVEGGSVRELHLTHKNPEYWTFPKPQALIVEGKPNPAEIRKAFPDLPMLVLKKPYKMIGSAPAKVIFFDVAKRIKGHRIIEKTNFTGIVGNPSEKQFAVSGKLPAIAFAYMAKHCMGTITHWNLDECPDLDDRTIGEIFRHRKELHLLNLSGYSKLSAETFKKFNRRIDTLILHNCPLENLDDVPCADRVSVSGCEKITKTHAKQYIERWDSQGFGDVNVVL